MAPSLRLLTLRQLAHHTRSQLRLRFALRLHVFVIALLTLLCLWTVSHVLMAVGIDTLALRYGVAVLVGYGCYLLLLRLWAQALARRESPLDAGGGDLPLPQGRGSGEASAELPSMGSGAGGDFGGGGASGSFDGGAADGVADSGASVLKGAGELLGAADEGIVVVVPLAVVIGVLLLLGGLLGTGVFMLFGVEVLMAVTVEVVLASAAGSLAYKGLAEGWLTTALSHTWAGALVALVLAVLLGAAVDLGLPEARSLPHAVQLLRTP